MLRLVLLAFIIPTCSMAQTVSNNNAPVQICQPKVIVKSCGTSCCNKPKVITKIVEKPVEVVKVVEVERPVMIERVVEKQVTRPNRILLLGGIGALGNLEEEYKPGYHSVYTENGLVMGLQYIRDFKRLSISIQGQTNRTGLIGVGFNF